MQLIDKANTPDSTAAAKSLDALIDLHTSSVDTLHGFQKMAEKAEPSFAPTAELFCALHGRHVARLDNMVREMGAVPDADGSFMGLVNKTVVTLRAAFDAIDSDVMDQVRSGEQNVINAFDHAIAASLPQGHLTALEQMKTELTSLLHETRHIGLPTKTGI